MSYRELRNFTETMKALGYTRIISVENFRTPNFELVADILYWLLMRYDPRCTIADDIETESQRVKFIRESCNLFSTKARLKINPKKVYASDGKAVQELLKIATMMFKAQSNVEGADGAQAHVHVEPDFNLANRTSDMKMARELTSEITSIGQRLFDLMKNEEANQKSRKEAISVLYPAAHSGGLDMDNVETEISQMSTALREESERMDTLCKELQTDEEALRGKIEKREQDLDRCKKRLKDLGNVRPAFMDEFEKLERELEKYYTVYIEKFRNVEYLEHQLEQYNQAEQEKLEESERQLKRMQKRLREEELRILRGEHDGGMDDDMLNDRPSSKGVAKGREVYGSLSGGSDSDDSDLSEVLDSDGSGAPSGSGSDDLIDDDDDNDDDDLSDFPSDEDGSQSSLSDNDF